MADTGIAALSPDDSAAAFANLPPVNLPSVGGVQSGAQGQGGDAQQSGAPLKLTITKAIPKGNAQSPDWYSALPDAAPDPTDHSGAQPAPQVAGDKNAKSPSWYSALPDAAPEAPPPPAREGEKPQQDMVGTIGDVGQQFGIGVGEGIVGLSPPGLVLNLSSLAQRGLDFAADHTIDPLMDAASRALGASDERIQKVHEMRDAHRMNIPTTNDLIHGALNLVGTDLPEPKTMAGEYANTTGQFFTGPGALIPKLAGAVTSETAGQFTKGTPAETPARLIGGILGGGSTAVAQQTAVSAKNAIKNAGMFAKKEAIPDVTNPKGPAIQATPAQLQLATEGILNSATDKNAVLQQLKNKPIDAPLGVQPTLGEHIDDQGLAQGQNAARQKAPEPFQQRAQDRQTAIASTLDEMGKQGNPQSVKDFVQRLVEEDGAKQEAALNDLMAQTDKQHTDLIAQTERNQKNAASRAARTQEKLGGEAQGKMDAIGHYNEEVPEGATATGQKVTDARAVRKGITKDKYKILDSVNNEDADMVSVRNRANDIEQQSQQYLEAPLGKTVKKLVDDILHPPEGAQDTIKTLRTLRSRISKAQRSLGMDERADMSHLQDLKATVDKALQNTVEGLALKNKSFYDKLSDALHETNQQAVAESQGAGRNTRVTVQGSTAKSAPLFSGKTGAKGKAGERPANVAGGEGVPKEEPPTRFGQQQLADYKDANQTYARFSTVKELEDRGIIDETGALNAQKWRAWRNKPKNAERLNVDPEFRDMLDDAAGARVKQIEHAEQSEESLKEGAKKGEAAIKASEKNNKATIDEFMAREAERLKEFQRSRLARFLPEHADAPSVIGRIFAEKTTNSATVFKELTDKISKDPEAMAGWQAATSKYINDHIASASVEEVEGSLRGTVSRQDMLRKFIHENKEALREIYRNGQGLNNLEQAAALIRRSQEFERRANIPGQSNTAKNFSQMARHGGEARVYDFLGRMLRGGGAFMGAHLFGPPGAAGGEVLGESLGNILKSNRFNTVEKIQLAMYSNPELTKVLAERFGAKTPPLSLQNRVAAQLRALVPPVATSADNETVKREPSSTRH